MAKSRKSDGAPSPQRARLSITISADVRKRLGAYAGSQGRAEWEIVEEALVSRLQGFYFGMRESRSVPATSEPSETVPFPRATG